LASHELTTKPKKIIFFGNTNNSTSGNLTLEQIRSKVLKTPEDYAALINLGSNLYQIQDANGTKGDQFYESIESLTRSVALMVRISYIFLLTYSPLSHLQELMIVLMNGISLISEQEILCTNKHKINISASIWKEFISSASTLIIISPIHPPKKLFSPGSKKT